MLRLAKKLPEKATNFFKELAKFRKAAITIGFTSILQGMSTILERECSFLSATNRDAVAILQHAVIILRSPCDMETINLPINLPVRKEK